MLLEHIERIRNESFEKRRRYAYIVSIGLTGIIVLIWLTTLLGERITGNGSTQDADVVPDERQGVFDDVRRSFDDANLFKSETPSTQVDQRPQGQFALPPSAADSFNDVSDETLVPDTPISEVEETSDDMEGTLVPNVSTSTGG